MTPEHDRPRVVFFGSGAFGLPTLDLLAGWGAVSLVGVITAPESAGRRRGGDVERDAVAVARRARELGLSPIQPADLRGPDAAVALASLRPVVAILADYGRIVPGELLAVPPRGFLNLHPSLLPRHRGASPISAAILAGDAETGVTLFLMEAGVDTGPVIASERLVLTGSEVAPEVERRLAELAADLLARNLAAWLAGRAALRPQETLRATTSRPLRRDDGRIDPTRSAVELERQVRAFQPWPGSFIDSSAGRLIVWRASVAPCPPAADGPAKDHPLGVGELAARSDRLALVTGHGCLYLEEVQPAGGRRMSAPEFLRGRGRRLQHKLA